MTRVLASHGAALGVADIARRARLALPSTRAAVRRLLDARVVTAVGAGCSMVCALDPTHPLAHTLVVLYTDEREQADAVIRAIGDAAAALRPAPLAVWLYGSVARADVRRLVAEKAPIWTEIARDAAVLAGDDPAGVLAHVTSTGSRA